MFLASKALAHPPAAKGEQLRDSHSLTLARLRTRMQQHAERVQGLEQLPQLCGGIGRSSEQLPGHRQLLLQEPATPEQTQT